MSKFFDRINIFEIIPCIVIIFTLYPEVLKCFIMCVNICLYHQKYILFIAAFEIGAILLPMFSLRERLRMYNFLRS